MHSIGPRSFSSASTAATSAALQPESSAARVHRRSTASSAELGVVSDYERGEELLARPPVSVHAVTRAEDLLASRADAGHARTGTECARMCRKWPTFILETAQDGGEMVMVGWHAACSRE
jgi:hypothetical protein